MIQLLLLIIMICILVIMVCMIVKKRRNDCDTTPPYHPRIIHSFIVSSIDGGYITDLNSPIVHGTSSDVFTPGSIIIPNEHMPEYIGNTLVGDAYHLSLDPPPKGIGYTKLPISKTYLTLNSTLISDNYQGKPDKPVPGSFVLYQFPTLPEAGFQLFFWIPLFRYEYGDNYAYKFLNKIYGNRQLYLYRISNHLTF